RKKAEAILKEKKGKVEQKDLESDVKKLLHELQVHQIELEMQNEELQQAYSEAQEALKKYTLLYDFAPMGYLTISGDGTILDLNFSAAEMIGEKRGRLINTNLKLFIADDSKSEFNAFIDKVFANKLKQSSVVVLDNGDNDSIRAYMEGICIEEDNQCILSFLDISKFKR
ncbi:MAG: PAS domain-containing protein, partial [Bacteroidales bacterium]